MACTLVFEQVNDLLKDVAATASRRPRVAADGGPDGLPANVVAHVAVKMMAVLPASSLHT